MDSIFCACSSLASAFFCRVMSRMKFSVAGAFSQRIRTLLAATQMVDSSRRTIRKRLFNDGSLS